MAGLFSGLKFFLSKNMPIYEVDRMTQILVREGGTISHKHELSDFYVIQDFEVNILVHFSCFLHFILRLSHPVFLAR
jgi:hypothetical protein